MMNTQAVVHIRKGEARSLKAGGMWIYDNEIERIEGEFENGDILRVEDFDGYPLGCGFINTRSKLTVRMLSRKKDAVIDDAFIEMRVRNAWEYRRQTGQPLPARQQSASACLPVRSYRKSIRSWLHV